MFRGRGRGRPRRQLAQAPPKFGWIPGSSDPQSATIEALKYVRISFELEVSASNVTQQTVSEQLKKLTGYVIVAAYSPIKISVFASPGVTNAFTRPAIALTVYDPDLAGSMGERTDYGTLDKPAHLHFRWPPHVQNASYAITTPRVLASVEPSNTERGLCVLSLRYIV